MGRSSVRGAAKMRRLLRQLPAAMEQEVVETLDRYGRQLAAVMRQRAPSRTGALRAGLSHKVFPKTLKLQVGLLGTKRGRAKLFYGYILDRGRRAQAVSVSRFRSGARASGAGSVSGGRKTGATSTYTMNVKGIAPVRFVSGPLTDIRSGLNTHLKGIWARAERRVSGGGDD